MKVLQCLHNKTSSMRKTEGGGGCFPHKHHYHLPNTSTTNIMENDSMSQTSDR